MVSTDFPGGALVKTLLVKVQDNAQDIDRAVIT
jgi:hypothetical protein